MPSSRKVGQLRFDGANPMLLLDGEEGTALDWTPEQEEIARTVSKALKTYILKAESLAAGQYADLREKIPDYMASPGNLLVVVCSDGIVARYERRSDQEPKRVVAVILRDIGQVAAMLSQNLVHIESPEAPPPNPETFGVELKFSVHSPSTGAARDVAASRIWFQVKRATPPDPPAIGAKPFCLLSVRNQLDVELHGVISPSDGDASGEQPFIARSTLRLLAGWECIEVFPGLDVAAWKLDAAPMWAERDLLGAILVAQTKDAQLSSLDPRASARKHYAALLAEFKSLLDSDPNQEQVLQTFLQLNPILLCPAHVRMWPKLQFGSTVSDFVFREATHDYLLVELERSTLPLFRQDGHPTAELTHASGQIIDWKRYIEDNLATVQRELGLTAITSNPNALIVMGRSATLQPHDRRKLQTMANQSPKLRVMTYDDVYDNARAVLANILGPLWDTGGATQIYYPAVRIEK